MWSRLIRFESSDGKWYYGEPILNDGVTDVRFCTHARVIEGDVLNTDTDSATNNHCSVTNTVLPVIRLLSPLDRSRVPTVRLLGLNYRKHAAEANMPIPKYPVLFYKPQTALSGPLDDIPISEMSAAGQESDGSIDYECELVVVIGKKCRNVRAADALDYVLGYTVGNDVSHRQWQIARAGSGQWGVGKMFDNWAPFGPCIVSSRTGIDPGNLRIWTKVNGIEVQNENTGDMIFSVQKTIEFLSAGSTLLPGDLIWMGTPSGVGMGRTPKLWLKEGDEVEIGLDNVGTIYNKVVKEAQNGHDEKEYVQGEIKSKL